ncbi:MAG: ketoacyl-ACP synthase III [Bacteroidia bacterium]|nr:ketoacyl-ACP synthase III [Bacteroidia bacterium]
MAYSKLHNVSIIGVSACVPRNIVENKDYAIFEEGEAEKFIATTGIERRRIVENGVCTSDLCFAAAEKLIIDLNWVKSDIEVLIFVSHTADYKLPATACILQDRLKLPINCMCFDITLGCSGYVHGLNVISSLLSSGNSKKGLLLVGNTQSMYAAYDDKSAYPLFADAGTATALEYNPDANEMFYHFSTDGSGYQAIIVPDGGCRNPVNEESFKMIDFGSGIRRSKLHEALDGMEVFSFGIRRAPETVNQLMEKFSLSTDDVDYFLFHQANKFMNERIRKKLKIPLEKTPYNIENFGNTSCATIPLLMVTNLQNELSNQKLNLVLCGFGVGLSWGSAYLSVEKIVCSDLIEI